jgi:hypothetical protein
LWFEAFSRRIGVPTWLGIVILGPLLFQVPYLLASWWLTPADSFLFTLYITPATVASMVAFGLFSLTIGRQVDELADHAREMLEPGAEVKTDLMFSRRGVAFLTAILVAITFPLFLVSAEAGSSMLAVTLFWLASTGTYVLLLATFMWVWVAAMVTLYRIGRLPLKLTSFAKDRFMGLRPFGAGSLRLTLVYEGSLLLVLLPDLFAPWFTPAEGAFMVGLLLLGPVLFVVPLWALRKKLVGAKRDHQAAFSPRYARAMDEALGSGDRALDSQASLELMALDKLRRDIASLPTWPYDSVIVVRLSAITLSVVTAIVIRIVMIVARI